MSADKGPSGWALFGGFVALVLIALLIQGLTVCGIGFGPLFVSFNCSASPPPGPSGPDSAGSAGPLPNQSAATLPAAYNGHWTGQGGIPGDPTLRTDFDINLTGGEVGAEVGVLQTEANGMPCQSALRLAEVDADQIVLSGDCGGGDYIVLKVKGENMEYYGGVQPNSSWYAISASLRRR